MASPVCSDDDTNHGTASPPPKLKERVTPPALALAEPSHPKGLLMVRDTRSLKQVLGGLALPAEARQQLEHYNSTMHKAIKEYSVNSRNILKDVVFSHISDQTKTAEVAKCAEFAKELLLLQQQVDP